jgi:trimeric autotransporter adhesin
MPANARSPSRARTSRTDYECDCVDCCPLVFDTSGRGYKLTSADLGVYFDINADGQQDGISWTDPSRDVAFLAFDRNGNGAIDHGEELFGNVTPLPGAGDERANHGFDALAALESDSYGPSVKDGTIDSRDAAYQRLLLWEDANHDGVSQSEELRTASAAGLRAIETRYRESKRRDQYGNEFRLRGISWWDRRGRLDARLFYDVWFVPRG